MKLFSTSALFVAATAYTANFPLLSYVPCSAIPGCEIDANGNVAYVDDAAEDNSRRRRRSTTSKKDARKARKESNRSEGYQNVKSDIEHGRFKKIIKAHGAQSIVDPWGLDQKEQFILHNILKEGSALTGKQLLNRLDNDVIDPEELNQFVIKQKNLLKLASGDYEAQNLALVGLEAPESSSQSTEEQPEVESEDEEDVPEVFKPVFQPRQPRIQHPNSHYPAEAFVSPSQMGLGSSAPPSPPTGRPNMPKFYSPEFQAPPPSSSAPSSRPGMPKFYTPPRAAPRSPPSAASRAPAGAFIKKGFNGIPGTSDAKLIAPIQLKSAMLAGRGLPAAAIKPKNDPQPHFVNANRQQYKIEELDYLSKEAKAVFVNIRKQMETYNELVDLIKNAKKELHVVKQQDLNDNLLASVSRGVNQDTPSRPQVPQPSHARPAGLPARRPLNSNGTSPMPAGLKAHGANVPVVPSAKMAAAINKKNDQVLASLRKNNEERVRAEKEAERKRTEAQQMAAYHHEQLMARNSHNDDMLARAASGQKSILADAREKVEEDVQEEPIQQNEMAFGSLSSMNIMTQYKIANFLRDNDDFTNEDWATIENMPNPTFGDIEKYYYMQQRVLRGDKIPRELNWMKKLKTSLWKGLEPDSLPVALPKRQQ